MTGKLCFTEDGTGEHPESTYFRDFALTPFGKLWCKNLLCMIYYPSHEIFRYQKLPHAFETQGKIVRSNTSLFQVHKMQNL